MHFYSGLGVMLLELAFEAPLWKLQQPVDVNGDRDDRYVMNANRPPHPAGLACRESLRHCRLRLSRPGLHSGLRGASNQILLRAAR
jgi:hypothetical protein